MGEDLKQPTPIDAALYNEFKQFVKDNHGQIRGSLRDELENAIRQYMDDSRGPDELQRIENDIASIKAILSESDGGVTGLSEGSDTHTYSDPDQSKTAEPQTQSTTEIAEPESLDESEDARVNDLETESSGEDAAEHSEHADQGDTSIETSDGYNPDDPYADFEAHGRSKGKTARRILLAIESDEGESVDPETLPGTIEELTGYGDPRTVDDYIDRVKQLAIDELGAEPSPLADPSSDVEPALMWGEKLEQFTEIAKEQETADAEAEADAALEGIDEATNAVSDQA